MKSFLSYKPLLNLLNPNTCFFKHHLIYRNNEWNFCITHSSLSSYKNAQLYSTRHDTITQNHFPTSIKNCLLWRSLIASIHKLLLFKEKRMIVASDKRRKQVEKVWLVSIKFFQDEPTSIYYIYFRKN